MVSYKFPRRTNNMADVRPESMERITTPELARAFIDEQLAALRAQIGDKKVLLALSGGVDSSVVAAMLIKAVGKQLTCVHVNHGLLRKGEPEQVINVFGKELGANLVYVDATDRFLDKLEGVTDPETKRKIIGGEFIEVFAEEARKLDGIDFLAQGTIWPDILESEAGIKAHHNAGGLPEDMKFELVEPVRILFKDEVRVVGKELGLPDNMVFRQPFPGPGLGVRCPGAITRDRLEAVRESDAILREEFEKNGLAGKVWQYFTVVPEFKSTGVKNGKRTFDWPCIIRAINTTDVMEVTVEHLSDELIDHLVQRIISEVPGINRVLFDYTPKPPATVEYE
ncbi:MAG: glutamine-hydrolyzing GMP synthase [Clostridiales bacterium]|nr:glutamine-hydrolyzing GMP synthase [Clostridiales bacterium]